MEGSYVAKCQSMSRSYTYARGNTTKNERIQIYGIFKREEQRDYISKVGEFKISV